MYDFGIRQALTGYRPAYRTNTACPGCGGSHWVIGRSSAECAFCATALPLAPIPGEPANPQYPEWANRA
jgi:hypothetical protein